MRIEGGPTWLCLFTLCWTSSHIPFSWWANDRSTWGQLRARNYAVYIRLREPKFGLRIEFGFLRQCLTLSIYLLFPEFPVGNHAPRFGFPSPFLGVPGIWKPSNFEPCSWLVCAMWTNLHTNRNSSTVLKWKYSDVYNKIHASALYVHTILKFPWAFRHICVPSIIISAFNFHIMCQQSDFTSIFYFTTTCIILRDTKMLISETTQNFS